MRVVLDTNVFISGIFFSGPPSKILKAWVNQSFQIVLSKKILDEYQRVAKVLSSKFRTIDIMPIIEMVTIHGEFVDTQGVNISACEDPDDDNGDPIYDKDDLSSVHPPACGILWINGKPRVSPWAPRKRRPSSRSSPPPSRS